MAIAAGYQFLNIHGDLAMKMLLVGGYINVLISALHLVGLAWAEEMFAITGIGSEMAALSKVHPMLPYILTIFVAVCFFVFGLYGISAGKGKHWLPYQNVAVFVIAAIYLLRGFGEMAIDVTTGSPNLMLELVYSLCAIAIGLLYYLGGRYLRNVT